MATIKTFRYRDYALHCDARALDNGKFAPTLLIFKQVWPTRPREVAVARGDHSTEEAAIEAARAQGVEWVTNYG